MRLSNRIMDSVSDVMKFIMPRNIFHQVNDDILKDHLADLTFLLKRNQSSVSDKLLDSVIKMRYLLLRLTQSDDLTIRNPAGSVPLHISKPHMKNLLRVDDIDHLSFCSWMKKLKKFPTLRLAMSVQDKDCPVCGVVLLDAPDVAILCDCDHITCLSCAQKWFTVTYCPER